MAFERITEDDLQGKGNLGRPDTPGVDTAEMQRILDELPREVIVPAFNRLAEQLEADTAAGSLGAAVPEGMPEDTPATVQGVLAAVQAGAEEHAARTDNPHAVTAAQTGAYTKAETDEAIGRRVVEIGAGDMAKAVYDPAGLGLDGTVQLYAHAKSGTVHDLAGSGANGRAQMTADVAEGDTFTVNGVPVTAYMGTDDAADAMAGSQWNGRWVSFVFDGQTLNFKGGGGRVTVSGLSAGKILEGTTVTVKQGAKTVAGVSGAIPSKSAAAYTPNTANQTIAAGQYLAGAQTIKGDANLRAENIRQGVSIFGVAGTMQPSPQPGTFTAYSGDTINAAMVGALQGSWGLNTQYHAIWAIGEAGTYVGWFSQRLDMTAYRSIAVRKWGGGWVSGKGAYKFGVGRTANQGEFVKYMEIPASGEGNNNMVYILDVSDVKEWCYLKFEGVNGGAAHGFNEVSLSV